MAYETYITDAVVVGSFASNTADKSYALFTERAGLVYASAKSVREERSRQRYALQDFSHITVTLVKGKTGWRIGSVDVYNNFYADARTRSARGSIVKLTKLLRRYVHGEIPEPHLYREFLAALHFLGQSEVIEREGFDLLASVRMLTELGYVAPPKTLDGYLGTPYETLLPQQVADLMPVLLGCYQGAQAVSHLERG